MVVACTYLFARFPVSQIVGYRQRANHCVVDRMKQIFFYRLRGEGILSRKRAAFDIRMYATIPFSPFANTDGFYGNRRSD